MPRTTSRRAALATFALSSLAPAVASAQEPPDVSQIVSFVRWSGVAVSTLVIIAAAVALRVTAEAGATDAARQAINARIAESTAVAAFAAADQERKSALKLAADIQKLIAPTATPLPSPTPTSAQPDAGGEATPVPISTPTPSVPPTPDLAATAAIEAVVQEIDQVQSRATQAAQTEVSLYALAPDANMSIFAAPDVNAERLAVVHSPDRLLVREVTAEWTKVRSAEEIEGWIRTVFFTFDGPPDALPAELQFRLVSNRVDLPFVYGRVIAVDGAEGADLSADPDDEQSGFRRIPVGWPVTLLQIGAGAQAYGSDQWGLVMLVDPDNATLIQQGWLPLALLAPRAEPEAAPVPQAAIPTQTATPTATASATASANVADAVRQIRQYFFEYGYQYEWPDGSASVTQIEANDDRLVVQYDHLSGELSGILQPADDGRWQFAGQWSQGEDGGDFELTFEADLQAASGWWNHGGATVKEEHSLQLRNNQ